MARNKKAKKSIEKRREKEEAETGSPTAALIPGLYDDVALNCLARVDLSDYSSIACVNRRLKSTVRTGTILEFRKDLGIFENWVFLFCDHQSGWEVFDTRRGRWTNLPPAPADECFIHADKESLAVGCELLVLGREITGVTIWKYSLLGQRWARAPPMNVARCLFGSGSNGNIGIFAGGSDLYGNVLSSAELYDSIKGEWCLLPDMHSPRRLSSGLWIEGKFVVIGGMSSATTTLTCGEEFDLSTWKWRRIEGMYPMANRAAQAPPLVAVVHNRLYSVDSSTNEVIRYEKAENVWTVMGSLPVRADTANGWGLAFKACCEEVMVVGGQRTPEGEAIVLNSWSTNSRPLEDGTLDWRVVTRKENIGVFVYNCAIMGC